MRKSIQLLTNAAANNSPPTSGDITAGFEIDEIAEIGKVVDFATLVIKGTRTSGTLTAKFRLWSWFPEISDWVPGGTGTDAAKGYLNAGAAVSEVTGNMLLHAERIDYPRHATAHYLEILSIGGTAPVINAHLVTEG